MATTTLSATCMCGAAKHEIRLATFELPLKMGFCHCNSCRRMTGTLHLTMATLPQSYEPATEVLTKLTPFEFSERLTQYFCSTCGTHMLAYVRHSAHDSSTSAQWDVMTGSLDKIDGLFEIESHDFIADTLDGGFSDFLISFHDRQIPRFAGHTEKSEELPFYWKSNDTPQHTDAPTDRLHCHCRCGGVNFWIARPSERSKKALGAWPDLLIPYYSNQPRSDGTAWWLRDEGRKFLAGLCSCNSCRLDTGMEFIEWAFVPTIDITQDAEGKVPFSPPYGTFKGYRSGRDVTRYHCGTCGASAIYWADDRTNLVDVAVGLMDAPEGARAETWLEWRTQRLSFREDALPRAKDLTLAVEHGLDEFGKRS